MELAYLEVSNNLLESVTATANNLLDNIAEVVYEEVESFAILCNRAKLCSVSLGLLPFLGVRTY